MRFFAGYDFDQGLLDDPEAVAKAYATGVPMGGDLIASGDRAPGFLLWAVQDPASAKLQRLQIIKGWTTRTRPATVAQTTGPR